MPVTSAVRRAAAALLLGAAVSTCRPDALGPGTGPRATLALAPVLPAQAAQLAAFGLAIDSLRVVVIRPETDTLVDTTVAFAADQDSLRLALPVTLTASAEQLGLTLELRGGGFVLFAAATSVNVTAGGTGANPPVAVGNFIYTGPGAGVTTLVVAPADSVIRLNDSLRFRVDAFAGTTPVTEFYVSWSTNNATLAPINAHGVLRAPNQRGGAIVTARTPTGVTAAVPVTFVPVPTSIVAVSPVPQNVLPGALIGPLRVRVLGSDGLGIRGATVTFAGGGGVATPVAVTDTGGYAQTLATAGPAGVSVFQASVAGVATPAVFNVTVLSTAASQLAFSVPPAGAVTGIPFGAVVEIRDAQGTLAATATNAVTVALGANPGQATLGGTLTVNAVGGVAVFGDLTLNQPGSGYTLVATATGLTPDTTAIFDAIAGFTGRLWANAAGGSWSNPANWSGGIVPTATDTVYIALDGTYTVTVDANVTVAKLFLGAASGTQTLGVASQTLQVDSMLSVGPAGVLQVTNGTVGGVAGTLFNQGRMQLQSAAVAPAVLNAGGGQLVARGTTTLAQPFTNSVAALTRIEGDAFCCAATLIVSGDVVNFGQIELTAVNTNGTTATLDVPGGTLVNAAGATIAVLPGTGGGRNLLAELDNQGTLAVAADLNITRTSAAHVNAGVVSLTTGNLTLIQSGSAPSFTTSGTVVIGAGRTLAITSGAFNYANAAPGGLGGTGTVSLNAVTWALATSFVHDTLGLALLNTTVNGPGTLTNPAGRTLTAQGTTFNAPFVNVGTFVARGTTTVAGGLTTTAGSTLQVQGDAFCCAAIVSVPGGFTNNGLVELTAINTNGTTAQLDVAGGALVNAGGATIASRPGTGGARGLNAQLDNQGTLLVEQDLTINRASAAHVNAGAVTLTTGSLSLVQSGTAPSFTTTGSIAIGAARTLSVTSGAFNYANAAPGGLAGMGTFSVNAVTVALAVDFTHDTLSLSSLNTTINGPGTLTNAPTRTLTVQGTTLNAPFVNQGTFVARGTTTVAGGFTTTPAGAIQVQGDAFCCAAVLSVPGGFTNQGLLELTAINTNGTTAQLDAPGGVVVNAPSGTLAVRAGTGGGRNITGALNNQGTILVEQSTALNAASADHLNSGAIQLTGGDLFLTQSGTNPTFTTSGSIQVGAGRLFQIAGGVINYTAPAGGLAGQGNVSFNGVTVNLSPGLHNDTIALAFQNSTVNGPGTLTNVAGRTLTAQSSVLNAPLVNDGLLVVRGTTSVTGGLTTATASTIVVQGDAFCCAATLSVPGGFTNNGQLELTAVNTNGTTATVDVPSGTLVNASGALLAVRAGTGGSRGLNAQLDNKGTILVEQDVQVNVASAAHLNSGAIQLTTGSLTLTQSGTVPSFVTTGSIVVGAGRTLGVTGGVFGYANPTAGGLAGRGTVSFNGTTVNLTPAFGNDTLSLSLLNSTVGGSGVLTNAPGRTLVAQSSAINAPFVNAGVFVARGTSSLGGALTAQLTGTLRVEGDAFCCAATLTIASSFTNAGLIELTAVNPNGTTAALVMPSGTLVNAGTLAVLPGTGGGRVLDAVVDNPGQLQLAHDVTVLRGITSLGVVSWTAGSVTVGNGATLDFPPTGAFNVSSPGQWNGSGLPATIVVQSRATMKVTTAGSTAIGPLAVINNFGTLDIQAPAALKVTGDFNHLVGAELLGTGTLDIAAASKITNTGITRPGTSPGILTIAGNWPMATGTTVHVDIVGLEVGTQYDQLVIGGLATTGGTLVLTGNGTFVPPAGVPLTIMTYVARTGQDFVVTNVNIGPPRNVTYGPTSITVNW